jgi:hypothetical protein
MGQMIQCEEGHWYDKSQNTRCPHCGVGPPDMTVKYKGSAGRSSDVHEEDETRIYQADAPARSDRSKSHDKDTPDPDATIAIWRKKSGIDPVVGWLACFEGPDQGRDYRIRSGRNVIGRDTSQHICIAGDETISRMNHATIFFDPKDASFYITADEGRSGVYVNGRVVLQPTLLKAYDVTEVGSTKLVFVPLCGERFRWDTGLPPPPPPPPAPTPRPHPNTSGREPTPG